MEQGFKTHPDGTVDRSNGLCNLCVTGCVCAWFYSGCVYGAGRTARPHRICSQSGPLLLVLVQNQQNTVVIHNHNIFFFNNYNKNIKK